VVADQYGLVRFLPSGSLDATFGDDGVASTGFNDEGLGPSGVAIQPNGKIIWVGDTTKPDGVGGTITDFAVARFNANGTLDSSFGTGGLVTTEFFADPLQGAMELAESVLVQPNGDILVGGVARQGQNKAAPYLGALARFTPSGALDSTFGTGGQVLSSSLPTITAIGLDAAGDIFVLPARSTHRRARPVRPCGACSRGNNGPVRRGCRLAPDSSITICTRRSFLSAAMPLAQPRNSSVATWVIRPLATRSPWRW
jgi:uncharacterized delta-60 repeat protein